MYFYVIFFTFTGGRGGRGGGGFRNRDNDDNDGGFRGNRSEWIVFFNQKEYYMPKIELFKYFQMEVALGTTTMATSQEASVAEVIIKVL